MKHKHAENMMQYAQDAMETDKPWKRWQIKMKGDAQWEDIQQCPLWLEYYEYRRKPRTVNINGHEVPEPVRSPLRKEQKYYIPVTNFYGKFCDWHIWDGDAWDECFLNRGLIHLSEEAAIKHAEALLSFTRIEK